MALTLRLAGALGPVVVMPESRAGFHAWFHTLTLSSQILSKQPHLSSLEMDNRKRLAFAIIQFLHGQLRHGGLSPDAQESLEGRCGFCPASLSGPRTPQPAHQRSRRRQSACMPGLGVCPLPWLLMGVAGAQHSTGAPGSPSWSSWPCTVTSPLAAGVQFRPPQPPRCLRPASLPILPLLQESHV